MKYTHKCSRQTNRRTDRQTDGQSGSNIRSASGRIIKNKVYKPKRRIDEYTHKHTAIYLQWNSYTGVN